MQPIARRTLLAGAGALGAVSLAGCTGASDADDEAADGAGGSNDSDGGDDPSPTGTQLGEITVENLGDGEHTVDVLVEFDGEIEHWSTHEFNSDAEGVTLEDGWPEEPGEFRVTARIDEGEFTQVAPENWSRPDCINLIIFVERDGAIQVAGVTDGGPCGDGDVAVSEAEGVEDDETGTTNDTDE